MQRLDRVLTWARRHWLNLTLLAVALFVIASAIRINAGERAQYRAAREAEAKVAQAEGVIVGLEASERELQKRASGLEEEIEKLRQTVPKVEIREVVKWRTREIRVPVPAEPVVLECPDGTLLNCPECPPIEIMIEGDEARLVSRKGNWLAVGRVGVWRLAPPPEEFVGWFPWESESVDVAVHERLLPPPPRGWGAGGSVGFLNGELAYGPAVAFPQWEPRIFGWRPEIEATASFVAGGGEWAVMGTAIIRF